MNQTLIIWITTILIMGFIFAIIFKNKYALAEQYDFNDVTLLACEDGDTCIFLVKEDTPLGSRIRLDIIGADTPSIDFAKCQQEKNKGLGMLLITMAMIKNHPRVHLRKVRLESGFIVGHIVLEPNFYLGLFYLEMGLAKPYNLNRNSTDWCTEYIL